MIFGPIGTSLDVAYVSDGTINAARGVRGSFRRRHAGRTVRIDWDGSRKSPRVTTCGVVTLQDGEKILTHTTGGGRSQGPRSSAEPGEVARDVRGAGSAVTRRLRPIGSRSMARDGWMPPRPRCSEAGGSLPQRASSLFRSAMNSIFFPVYGYGLDTSRIPPWRSRGGGA